MLGRAGRFVVGPNRKELDAYVTSAGTQTYPHDDALARGAARFTRLEGCHFAVGAYWFSDTAGREARRGQLYRLLPGPEGVAGADTPAGRAPVLAPPLHWTVTPDEAVPIHNAV